MKIKVESVDLPETEVIIRGDAVSEEVISLLRMLRKRNSGKLILYKEEEQYLVNADEIVYMEVNDGKVYVYREVKIILKSHIPEDEIEALANAS